MKEYAYIHEEGSLLPPLKAVPFLNSFTDEQLDEVLNSSSLLQCDVGDVIIEEGSIDTRIYILLSGDLEVRVGKKRVTTMSRPGDVFGEVALVNQEKRGASVIAGSRALCLAVDQKFLQDMHPREEDPAFHAALFEFVARLVTKKLEATSRRLAEVERELRELTGQTSVVPLAPNTKPPKVAKSKKAAAKKPTAAKASPAVKKKAAVKKPAVPAKAKKAAKRKR
jgi:CRP-like cAMP-binding protein